MELKELKGYLGYGVKCLYFDDERGISQICNIETLTKEEAILASIEYEHVVNIKDVRLVLRPMSDLTKPYLEGGKVPIVELAKIAYPKGKKFIEMSNSGICTVDTLGNYVFDYITTDCSFACTYIPENRSCIIPNQLQLFEKLYEWHFDVHGLIERKEAIDINTTKH